MTLDEQAREDRLAYPRRPPMTRRPVRARAWNAAGAACGTVGRALHRAGLALCGLSGYLDARADNAGYWRSG